MKFRYKGIISGSIVAFFPLFFLGILINEGTLYIFLLVLAIYIIAIFFRYNNYIQLDDDGITQVKFNLLFKKESTTIAYKDISDISFEKNNELSQENIGKHQICAKSGTEIKFGKIFHFKKFKNILNDKIEDDKINISSQINDYIEYIDKTSPDYFKLTNNESILSEIISGIILFVYLIITLTTEGFDFRNIIIWPNITILIPIFIIVIFLLIKIYKSIKNKSFVMLGNDSLTVATYSKSKYNIQKIPYSNIEKIEINMQQNNIISNMINGSSFYIILKKKEEKIQGLQNCDKFIEALKRKGINANYTSSNEMILNLK